MDRSLFLMDVVRQATALYNLSERQRYEPNGGCWTD